MRRLLLIICLCIGISSSGSLAIDYTVQTVPNVLLTDKNNRVSNPDGIISLQDVDEINRQLALLEDSLGIEVAVVAIESIGDYDARMFGTDLFNYWGIGKKADDNGLLIQLITEPLQRSVVFETGYGLEGVLPDAICYRLQQRYMIPDMRDGDYSTGLLKGVIAVKDYLLASDYERKQILGSTGSSEEEIPFGLPFLFIFVLFAGIFIVTILSSWLKHRPKICPKCGKKTFVFVRRQVIQKATYSSEGLAMDIYRCKNCGFTENKNRKINRLRQSSSLPPIIRDGGSSRGGFGGGFGGGSWGGGRSGGGGSISRF